MTIVYCWYQWRAIFFKLSEYSKLPPGLGCTAPSYLPRPRPGWCPCVGRGYQPGRGAAFVTRNISCSASSRQLREGCGFQFIKQQIIPRLRVRHRRTRYLPRREKKKGENSQSHFQLGIAQKETLFIYFQNCSDFFSNLKFQEKVVSKSDLREISQLWIKFLLFVLGKVGILYCVISFSMLCLRVASSPPALAPVTPLQWSPRPQPGPHRNATHRCLPPAVSGHIQYSGFFGPFHFCWPS